MLKSFYHFNKSRLGFQLISCICFHTIMLCHQPHVLLILYFPVHWEMNFARYVVPSEPLLIL